MHRRILSGAIFAIALFPGLTPLVHAQAVPAPAGAAASQGTDTGASAPANTGGRRGGRNGGGGAQFGGAQFGGTGNGGGGRGGRGGRGGQFGAAGVAGPAGTDGIATVVTPAGGGNPNVPGGAIGGGNPGFGPGGNYVAVTGQAPNYDELVDVQMNGQGAQEVLDWLQRNTGKIILQSQTLPAVKIVYSTHAGPNNALPRKVVIDNVISLLALNKILITELDEHTLKAETSDPANLGRGLPMADDAKLAGPPSEMIYTHIFHLNNITSDDGAQRIVPFMSSTSTAMALPKENSIFVADSLLNLQHIADALKLFDTPVATQQEITVHVMQNARAADVASNLTALQAGVLSPWFGPAFNTQLPTTLFAADARTNALIVVTNKSNHDMVQQLIDQYDSDQQSNTKTRVYNLRQSLANDMRTLLQSIVTGVQQTTGARAGGGAGGNVAGGGAGPAGASASRDSQFSQYVTIASDTRSNSIVAFGTTADLNQIGDLIDRVDVLLPQARIEAIITEVTLTKNDTTGLSAFGINYGGFVPGNGTSVGSVVSQDGNKNYTATVGSAGAPAFLINGTLTKWDLNTVFGVARSNSNVVILSNPFVTATHALQSVINDGQRVPTINGSASTNGTATNTVTYQDVSVQLAVTPFIGKDGSISMQITQNISSIQGNITNNGITNPIFGTRYVVSNVTVHDGDVLVLGGMRKRTVSQTHGVLFLLGEIPIVGQLFQPDQNDTQTTELIIFLKPTIIKDTSNTQAMLSEIAANSQSGDIAMRYQRTHDLNTANEGIHNPNIKPDATPGPSAEHSSQNSAKPSSTPTPSTTLTPAAGSTTTSSTTMAPAPAPAASAPSSPKPTSTVQGFNK